MCIVPDFDQLGEERRMETFFKVRENLINILQ